MKQLLKVVALSTFCLVLSGCDPAGRERFKAIPIPAERMDCQAATKVDRPSLAPTYVIDWSKVLTAPAAKVEVDRLISSVLNREGIVTGYVIQLEGKLFACSNDAQWLREYTAQVEK